MTTHLFGYAASAILLGTLAVQIRKQWARGSTQGVSRWLFVGQFLASVGFAIHSAVIGSTLFMVVNALLAGSASIGAVLWSVQRRRERRLGRASSSVDARGGPAPPRERSFTREVGT